MTLKAKLAPVAAVLALAAALLLSALPSSRAEAAPEGLGNLVGQWRMSSLEVTVDGSYRTVPYSGQIVFTKAGTMAVQAMNPDASAPDTTYTVNGYEAFYGDVALDRRAGTFTVTVESAAARALIGQQLTRVFDVSGRTLVLTPADPSEGWRVTYERV
jgi:hypothetical protein